MVRENLKNIFKIRLDGRGKYYLTLDNMSVNTTWDFKTNSWTR